MKKILAMVLAMLMLLSAVAFAEEEVAGELYVDVVGSWELCGGSSNGVEWEQETLDQMLIDYGGVLQFNFYDDFTAEMVQGAGIIPGTFTLETGSEYMMATTFMVGETELVFYCMMTVTEDQVVMLLTNDDGVNFQYFTPVVAEVEEAA